MTELVSVLTPSLNQARWLEDNLRSVRAQTHPRIEHIVMDGASTDGTVELLSRVARQSVTWRSEPDHGQSHALNKAFAESRGEVIGWLNADDAYYSREAVAAAVAALKANPSAAVVYGHSALVDGSNRLLHFNWAPSFSRRLFAFHNFIVQPAAFVRRSALDAILVDESFDFTMDRELWLRLTARHDAVRVPFVLALDRHHPTRKSYTMPEAHRSDTDVLSSRYGVPPLHARRLRRKAAKTALRLAGTTLAVGRSARARPAIEIERPALPPLLARQALLPRRLQA